MFKVVARFNWADICDFLLWLDDNMEWWEFEVVTFAARHSNSQYKSHCNYYFRLIKNPQFVRYNHECEVSINVKSEEDFLLLKLTYG